MGKRQQKICFYKFLQQSSNDSRQHCLHDWCCSGLGSLGDFGAGSEMVFGTLVQASADAVD